MISSFYNHLERLRPFNVLISALAMIISASILGELLNLEKLIPVIITVMCFTGAANAINDFRMIVYDRWGAVVFESNSMYYGWDGLDDSGFLVSPGTYVYHISVYDENERFWVYNGEVNLFR